MDFHFGQTLTASPAELEVSLARLGQHPTRAAWLAVQLRAAWATPSERAAGRRGSRVASGGLLPPDRAYCAAKSVK